MLHRETFEAMALPFLDDLYRTAYRMVHDQRTAERCVQQAYVEAFNSFHHLPEVTDHRAWLFIALFRCLRNRRKAWLHIKGCWLTHSNEEQCQLADADQPGDVADQDPMLRTLDRIPGIYREVLLLADVEGFDRTAIQGILKIPADLVASRLAEGRARLRTGINSGGRMNPPLAEDPAMA